MRKKLPFYLLFLLLSAGSSSQLVGQEIGSLGDPAAIKYYSMIKHTNESVSLSTQSEVLHKILTRPLSSNKLLNGKKVFGLHGMDSSFIRSKYKSTEISLAYEILAKTGVQRFRTSDSMWHRFSPKLDNFYDLDSQTYYANKYGFDFIFMTGYPPEEFNLLPSVFSTFKPEFEPKYRKYIRVLFGRYNKFIKEAEVGNEVDYPSIWWIGGSPQNYVRDCRILKEELKNMGSNIKIVGFAATGSRTKNGGGPKGGQSFVNEAFKQGIDKYVDKYSLHYTWLLREKKFIDFFRSQLSFFHSKKPLINSEDTSFSHPSDIIKVFARNLFLYNFESVDYFLARDYFEGEKLFYSGLFDISWKPKLRLLSYALSVDAMGDRDLIGMSNPSLNVEAYVLQKDAFSKSNKRKDKYSIVMWRNSDPIARNETTELKKSNERLKIPSIRVDGIKNVFKAYNWRLDGLKFEKINPVFWVNQDPIVIFTDKLPNWKLISAHQWLYETN